jgi:TolB protein
MRGAASNPALNRRVALPALLCLLAVLVGDAAASAGGTDVGQLPGTIAFASDRQGVSNVYLVNRDGTGLRRLVAGSYPSWSPDGSKLAFYGPRGIFPLEIVDADGRAVRTIAETASYAWSPESKRIVFTKSVEGHLSLYLTRTDGTGRRRLTNGDDDSPAWSVRNQIAFLRSFPSGPGYSQSLMVINSDGTGQQGIAADVGLETPAWSPDGSKIAFTKEAQNGVDSNLFVANADGQDVRRISRRPGYGLQSAWSPDGTQIAFSGLFGSDSELLFVAKADGSQLRQIHHRIGGSDAAGAYAWSPDGDALAVTAGAPNDILVIQLASGRAKRITYGVPRRLRQQRSELGPPATPHVSAWRARGAHRDRARRAAFLRGLDHAGGCARPRS